MEQWVKDFNERDSWAVEDDDYQCDGCIGIKGAAEDETIDHRCDGCRRPLSHASLMEFIKRPRPIPHPDAIWYAQYWIGVHKVTYGPMPFKFAEHVALERGVKPILKAELV